MVFLGIDEVEFLPQIETLIPKGRTFHDPDVRLLLFEDLLKQPYKEQYLHTDADIKSNLSFTCVGRKLKIPLKYKYRYFYEVYLK